ncbi:hypothetical protein MGYG_04596 [Nannizzia gypsea CBS 118893]|uniref:Uncharacterized protein n=1 Tax=Arthroderma gypseum (strain ATCC MYA-4604 / CBS 118893) TaxID=535722 RepID=E4UU03_ARTGP|nr:hypothetical protein MGYG_04596 [Nannizzia gypsea CBS 118893]EFR01593.1 hypothetical protein MGYG_04596 [Nannizzia gypsea CBS 118893]
MSGTRSIMRGAPESEPIVTLPFTTLWGVGIEPEKCRHERKEGSGSKRKADKNDKNPIYHRPVESPETPRSRKEESMNI